MATASKENTTLKNAAERWEWNAAFLLFFVCFLLPEHKAGSARSSDSGANPIDEITGESSSGTNSSAPEFSISFDRNMRAASRLAWCHLMAIALIVVSCICGAEVALQNTSLGSSYMTYMLMFALVAPICYCLKYNFQQILRLDRENCLTVLSICIQNQYQQHLMEGLRWKLSHTQGLRT